MSITQSYDFYGVRRIVIGPMTHFKDFSTRTIYLIDAEGEECPIKLYTEKPADIPVRVEACIHSDPKPNYYERWLSPISEEIEMNPGAGGRGRGMKYAIAIAAFLCATAAQAQLYPPMPNDLPPIRPPVMLHGLQDTDITRLDRETQRQNYLNQQLLLQRQMLFEQQRQNQLLQGFGR